jgi:chaperonin GroES
MDRVFVKRLPRKEKTKSGIIIPDHRKSKRLKVEVLAVGPGKYSPKGVLIPMSVKVGDIVIIDQYAGAVVEGAEDDEIIVREDEILGVVNGDPDDVKI